MPAEREHIALANRCQAVLAYLLASPNPFPEWVVVVAFYKALHLVEAMFARDPNIQHGRTHADRHEFLKTSPVYQAVFPVYRKLYAAARVARYLEDPGGKGYSTFSAYLPPGTIKAEMLKFNLRAVEDFVLPKLSESPAKALQRYTP